MLDRSTFSDLFLLMKYNDSICITFLFKLKYILCLFRFDCTEEEKKMNLSGKALSHSVI